MSVSLSYTGIGKGVEVDGDVLIDYYGNDFNPTNPTIPSNRTSLEAYNTTSSFNLNDFQPGHEVGCAVFNLTNDGESNETFQIKGNFQRLKNSTWTTSRDYSWSGTVYAGKAYGGWMYFGVDDDEIWDGYSSYRIMWGWSASGGDMGIAYSYFTVSNLDIDSNLYPAGCLWIDGVNLCYTDGVYGSEGFKHKIAYDSSVYTYVGRDAAGCIWMEDSGATAMQRLYYVTENGYKTRTYGCQTWYGGNVNVGSSKQGCIRVPTGDMDKGYGHLCYVTATGQKLRVLNGPPEGYV